MDKEQGSLMMPLTNDGELMVETWKSGSEKVSPLLYY